MLSFSKCYSFNLAYIQSREHLIRFLDGFKYLTHASFQIKSSCIAHQSTELIVDGTRRLAYGTFTCRVYNLSNESPTSSVNFWFGEQVTFSIIFDFLLPYLIFFSNIATTAILGSTLATTARIFLVSIKIYFIFVILIYLFH